MEKKKIKVLSNGPYEVSASIPLNKLRLVPNAEGASLSYEKVESYPKQDKDYHLCRCGASKNKPFCDGSHVGIHFEGKTTASHAPYEELAEVIEGPMVDLLDAEEYCAVARFCDTNGSTWNLVTNGETEDEKEIAIRQCAHCASGRLTIMTKDGNLLEPKLEQEISILEDTAAKVHGPIWVKGGIEIEDEHGKPYPVRNRVTLCRCGMSQNKPFCDGLHMHSHREEA